MKLKFLTLSFLLLLSATSPAQSGLYIDGGLLHANKNGILRIEGELQNKAGSNLLNDGVIEIAGDFTNDSLATLTNGSDASSTERLYKFIGSGTQQLKGNFSDTATRYLYNAVIDKAASGSAILLNTAAYVKGSLVFGSATTGSATYTPTTTSTLTNNSSLGVIKTFDSLNNDYELYIINSSVSAIKGHAPLTINGAPTDGYIINRGAQGIGTGGLSRTVSQTGIPYVFPIGSDLNGYNAVVMNFSSIASGSDKVRGLFVNATGGIGSLGNYCHGCGTMQNVQGFNYYFPHNPCNSNRPQWVALNTLPRDHGYWSYTGNASDVYTVEMYPNSFSLFGSGSGQTWRIIKKSASITAVPSGDWMPEMIPDTLALTDLLTYTTNMGCYSGTGVPGGVFTGFSHFQMLKSSANIGLPIKLVSLNARSVADRLIQLTWITAEETDNRGFEILRSEDGTDFQSIGWVNAQGDGNSSSGYEYGFDDPSVRPNIIYYYRLRQMDFDGTPTETYIVQAQIGGADITAVSDFFPNPAASHSQVAIHSPSNASFVTELYSITGQLVTKARIEAPAGDSLFDLNTDNLPAGNYKAVIKNDMNVFIKSLNIIR
jgi:hypothetical protein